MRKHDRLTKLKGIMTNEMKNHWMIYIVIFISLVIHVAAFVDLGFNYSLNSDDVDYVKSGIVFVQTGTITMHDVLSAQIMPGMTFMMAFFVLLFGTGQALIVAIKIFYMLMGLATIYVVYRTIRLYTNQYFAAIPCLFFLALDYIWMDNLTLTETPSILLLALLIYHTFKISIKPNTKDYVYIVIYYIAAVFIRPNFGIYPIFLFVFLLMKKYDFKLLIKQCLIAGIVLLVTLVPWTYRNYKVFGEFIPLTYGMGNPLLLGTYQGVGYPADADLDYQTNVDDKMPEEMRYYLENPEVKPHMTKYYSLEYDGMKAKYRMQEWWQRDKISMIKSYCYHKPIINLYGCFYWDTLFDVGVENLVPIRGAELILFGISSLIILCDRKRMKEWLFLIMVYGSQIVLYSYAFALNRYGITFFFIRYLIIGIGLSTLWKKIRRGDTNESISNRAGV